MATALLVLVGVAQVAVLAAQHRQHRLNLAETYWRRWANCQQAWTRVVFVGRYPGDYYQLANSEQAKILADLVEKTSPYEPSMWALQAVSTVSGLLSDVCLQILYGQLSVADAYAVFGTAFLRQCPPLRYLLDADARSEAARAKRAASEDRHLDLQAEVQDWLIYHDGVRRRCLILIDLLWAEAARLEDLPPADLTKAAHAKRATGHLNRQRLWRECVRLRGVGGVPRALRLRRFLRHGEFRRGLRLIGLRQGRLDELEAVWVNRLLHKPGSPYRKGEA